MSAHVVEGSDSDSDRVKGEAEGNASGALFLLLGEDVAVGVMLHCSTIRKGSLISQHT